MREYCHIFGEMDLYLDQDIKKMYAHALDIGEQCGYAVYQNKEKDRLDLFGSDSYEIAKVYFKNGKAVKVTRSNDEGKNWETLNFKDNIFEVDKETLQRYKDKIEFFKVEKGLKLPMSQGLLIEELIKRYKMFPLKVGYHFDHIAIETQKQIILWRDNGIGAELLGVIDKK
jgi:hypothetical protein